MSIKDVLRRIPEDEKDLSEQLQNFLDNLARTQGTIERAQKSAAEAKKIVDDSIYGGSLDELLDEGVMTERDIRDYDGELSFVSQCAFDAEKNAQRLVTLLLESIDANESLARHMEGM